MPNKGEPTYKDRIVAYIYNNGAMKRKDLSVVFPDIYYRGIVRSAKKAIDEGLLEVFRKNKANYVNITVKGTKYIKESFPELCDAKLRRKKMRRQDNTYRVRVQAQNYIAGMMKTGGAQIVSSDFFEEIFKAFSPQRDYLSKTQTPAYIELADLKQLVLEHTARGDETLTARTKCVGTLFTPSRITLCYDTLGHLITFYKGDERRVVEGIREFAARMGIELEIDAIVFGQSDAMLPKLYHDSQYGKTQDINRLQRTICIESLLDIFDKGFFIPKSNDGTSATGFYINLSEAALEDWCDDYAKKVGLNTKLRMGSHIEYLDDDGEYWLILPVTCLNTLVDAVRDPMHKDKRVNIFARKTSVDGISRTLGSRMGIAKELFPKNDQPNIPVRYYDDNGEALDGYKPFTKGQKKVYQTTPPISSSNP